jgi:phospholipid transport system substrate-binding protein
MRFGARLVLISFFLLLVVQNTRGERETPLSRVQAILEEVITIQSDPGLQGEEFRSQRKKAIKKVILQNFHFDTIVKQVLGSHWNELNETKREEFKTLFKDLFQESYTKLVLDFLKKERILYTNEDIQKGGASVKTIILRVNEEISIDYSLTQVDQRWMVDDIRIDGVSIVQNYQKSFSRVIKQESLEGLLRKMRLQREALEKNS